MFVSKPVINEHITLYYQLCSKFISQVILLFGPFTYLWAELNAFLQADTTKSLINVSSYCLWRTVYPVVPVFVICTKDQRLLSVWCNSCQREKRQSSYIFQIKFVFVTYVFLMENSLILHESFRMLFFFKKADSFSA